MAYSYSGAVTSAGTDFRGAQDHRETPTAAQHGHGSSAMSLECTRSGW